MKKILFAVAVLAIAGASTAAWAGSEAVDPPSQTVTTAGVDFRDRTAVDGVYRQMTRTAEAVCDSYAANSRVTAADRDCASKALANAVRRANQPVLTAVYESERRPPGRSAGGAP